MDEKLYQVAGEVWSQLRRMKRRFDQGKKEEFVKLAGRHNYFLRKQPSELLTSILGENTMASYMAYSALLAHPKLFESDERGEPFFDPGKEPEKLLGDMMNTLSEHNPKGWILEQLKSYVKKMKGQEEAEANIAMHEHYYLVRDTESYLRGILKKDFPTYMQASSVLVSYDHLQEFNDLQEEAKLAISNLEMLLQRHLQ